MKKLISLIAAGILFYSCASNKDIGQEFISTESTQQTNESSQTLEHRLDIDIPSDVAQLISPERKYIWSPEKHVDNSVSWYNPSLKTLDTGLRNGDLVVVLFSDNITETLVVADEARVHFYSDIQKIDGMTNSFGQVTIEYRIGERWFETSPRDPEGNIDLLHSNKGGVYRTVDAEVLLYWPENPFVAMDFKPTK